MADVVTPEVRSRMMAGIKAKNTKPEMIVRSLLHSAGYRFRLHRKDLPGRPDVVLPKWRTVIFVHGCFWHGHENCPLYRLPKSRPDFWTTKIAQNRARDTQNLERLVLAHWRTLVVWECALKGKSRLPRERVFTDITRYLRDPRQFAEIRGEPVSAIE